jgi:hypothetical protein
MMKVVCSACASGNVSLKPVTTKRFSMKLFQQHFPYQNLHYKRIRDASKQLRTKTGFRFYVKTGFKSVIKTGLPFNKTSEDSHIDDIYAWVVRCSLNRCSKNRNENREKPKQVLGFACCQEIVS